jgi:hypothetical protein
MHDVVTEDGKMVFVRAPVKFIWAQIDAALNLPIYMTTNGYSFKESQDAWYSHRVIIRSQSHIEAACMAWVYEEKRRTSPRWYKLLGFTESDNWTLLITHLVERAEDMKPVEPPIPRLGLRATQSAVTL